MEKAVEKKQADLRKMVAPDEHITAAASLADRLEALLKRYGGLAADKDVVGAIARINSASRVTFNLGPSGQLKAELPRLAKIRDQAKDG